MRQIRLVALLFLSFALLLGAVANPPRLAAAVDGEILAHQGVQHYLHGDYRQARNLLAQAAALEPRQAALHLTLGLCHLALQEYGAARRAFSRALELEPSIERGQLYLGICHYFLGEYPEAEAALERARRQDPQDGLASYYQALVAVQADRPRQAMSALAQGYRLKPELAEHFRPLEQAALIPKDVRPKKFRLEAQAGGQYDSNVPLIPKQFLYRNPRKGGHHVDWGGRIGGRVEYYPLLQPNLSLGLRGRTFYNQYIQQDNWNWFANRAEALFNFKTGPVLWQPRAAFDYTFYSAKEYSSMGLFGLTVNWPQTSWLKGEITYRALRKHFYYTSWPQFNRSGWEHQVGFYQGVMLREVGVIRVGAAYERNLGDRSYDPDVTFRKGEFMAYDAFRALVQGVFFLPWDLTGWADLQFAYVDFDNFMNFPEFEKKRLDRFYQAQLLLKKPVTRHLALWVGFSHTYNRSNLDSFKYQRTLVPFFISYTFF